MPSPNAFTDEDALARIPLARREVPGNGEEFVTVVGTGLLDGVVPQLGVPAAVAVDVRQTEGEPQGRVRRDGPANAAVKNSNRRGI
jgi:hypothetical protein